MINLTVDILAKSATEITSGVYRNIPIIGDAVICADNTLTKFTYLILLLSKFMFGNFLWCKLLLQLLDAV